MKLLKTILLEIATNGKSVLAYILAQFPALNGYPMLVGALEEFAAHPTTGNAAKVGLQVLWAVATGHRVIKLLGSIAKKL